MVLCLFRDQTPFFFLVIDGGDPYIRRKQVQTRPVFAHSENSIGVWFQRVVVSQTYVREGKDWGNTCLVREEL